MHDGVALVWKHLHAPVKDDEPAVAKHKARLDELAKATQKVQRLEAVVKAREALFLSEQKSLWKSRSCFFFKRRPASTWQVFAMSQFLPNILYDNE